MYNMTSEELAAHKQKLLDDKKKRYEDAPGLGPDLCPQCGWHVSSHGLSQYGLDCPGSGNSPAAQQHLLPERKFEDPMPWITEDGVRQVDSVVPYQFGKMTYAHHKPRTKLEYLNDRLVELAASDSTERIDLQDATMAIIKEHERILRRLKAARANHPECDRHSDGDVVTCGWKLAVIDMDKILQTA